MITDEERRVVASSLRESANVGGARTLKRELAKALGIRLDACTPEGSRTNILRGLADLIDRPTCENGERLCERTFLCSSCGYEAYTYSDSDCNPHDFSYCPECGAEAVEP